ncbi:MAG: D-alanyl-D-alanine dipeptidase, partial [Ignavibacteriales bacterium]
PEKGSSHNRGCSVDLTIVDLVTGNEVVMLTGYDNFTEKAGHNFNNLPDEAIKNREKLKNIMIKYGFDIYTSEWWHYDFRGWENFELMDISFEELEALEIFE